MYIETSLLELLKKEDLYVRRLQVWEKSVKENTENLNRTVAFYNDYKDQIKGYQTRVKNATESRDKFANKLQTVRDQIKVYLKEVISV